MLNTFLASNKKLNKKISVFTEMSKKTFYYGISSSNKTTIWYYW